MNAKQLKFMNDPASRPFNFVISQPRCGSTLLMRLMYIAGSTPVMGEYHLEFYKGIMDTWNYGPRDAIFKNICLMEEQRIFGDMYRSWHDEESYKRMNAFYIKSLLYGSTGASMAKATGLGLEDGLGLFTIKEWTDTLRDIHDQSGVPLNIVFLRRPHEEILKSWNTSRYAENKIDISFLKEQDQQMKDAWQLGDICITYDQLVNNTQDTLIKLKPRVYPTDESIDRVMKNKIR